MEIFLFKICFKINFVFLDKISLLIKEFKNEIFKKKVFNPFSEKIYKKITRKKILIQDDYNSKNDQINIKDKDKQEIVLQKENIYKNNNTLHGHFLYLDNISLNKFNLENEIKRKKNIKNIKKYKNELKSLGIKRKFNKKKINLGKKNIKELIPNNFNCKESFKWNNFITNNKNPKSPSKINLNKDFNNHIENQDLSCIDQLNIIYKNFIQNSYFINYKLLLYMTSINNLHSYIKKIYSSNSIENNKNYQQNHQIYKENLNFNYQSCNFNNNIDNQIKIDTFNLNSLINRKINFLDEVPDLISQKPYQDTQHNFFNKEVKRFQENSLFDYNPINYDNLNLIKGYGLNQNINDNNNSKKYI